MLTKLKFYLIGLKRRDVVSQLIIADLIFFDLIAASDDELQGGALVPFPSTALDTDLDTRLVANLNNTGDLQTGFNIQTLTLGSGTGAAASAVSIFGKATADTETKA